MQTYLGCRNASGQELEQVPCLYDDEWVPGLPGGLHRHGAFYLHDSLELLILAIGQGAAALSQQVTAPDAEAAGSQDLPS